jgi:hypothetical protein
MCGLLRRLLVFAFIVQCLERHSTPPGWVGVCFVLVFLSVVLAAGSRPVPFRTRKLSLPAPMVLHLGGCGRVGRRRHCFLCGVWLQQSLWLLWPHTTFFMRVSGWVCGGAPPRGRRVADVREGAEHCFLGSTAHTAGGRWTAARRLGGCDRGLRWPWAMSTGSSGICVFRWSSPSPFQPSGGDRRWSSWAWFSDGVGANSCPPAIRVMS